MKSVRSCISDGRGLHVFSLSSYGLQPRACSSSNTSLSVSLGLSAALSDMNMAGVTKSLRFPRPKLADLRKLALYGYFYRKSSIWRVFTRGQKGTDRTKKCIYNTSHFSPFSNHHAVRNRSLRLPGAFRSGQPRHPRIGVWLTHWAARIVAKWGRRARGK